MAEKSDEVRSIDEFCEWSLDYDLWCKNYFFGEAIQIARNASKPKAKIGKGNMLNLLPDIFSATDAKIVRKNSGKEEEKTTHMLAVWTYRGYITFNEQTQMFEKTDKYRLKN